MTEAPLIFISHARDDASPIREQLREHLAALERAGKAHVWIDLDFKPGQPWELELNSAIEKASVAVLLVSTAYLNRDFIRDKELPMLADQARRGLKIMPLILEDCLWETVPLISAAVIWPNEKKRLNALSPIEQSQALVRFVKHIAEAIAQSPFNQHLDNYPVRTQPKGPSARNRPVPVGREAEKSECLNILHSDPALVLFGVPGQGKTELARYVGKAWSEGSGAFFEVNLQNEQQVDNLPRLISTELGDSQGADTYERLRQGRSILLLDSFDKILQNNDPKVIGRTLDFLFQTLGDHSRIIITSQQRVDKAGIVPKKVRRLTAEFALQLFAAVSGDTYNEAESAELKEFVDKDLTGHPLSIKIVARYFSAVRIPAEDLRRLWREKWGELANQRPSLDDNTLLASFELSYATLSHLEQVLLLLMSLVPDGIGGQQIKQIWPDKEMSIYGALRTLSDRAFLDEASEPLRLIGPLFHFASDKRARASQQPEADLWRDLQEYTRAIDAFVDIFVQSNAPQATDVDPKSKNELIQKQFHNIHASLERRLTPSQDESTLAAATNVLRLYWAYHNNLGALDNPMVSPVDAVKYLKKAHDVYVANKMEEESTRCQYYIGNILWLRGDIPTAKLYLRETVANKATPEIMCDSRRAFAHIEYKEGSLIRASELYQEVINSAREIGFVECVQRSLVGLLDAYRKLEEYGQGFELFEKEIRSDLKNYRPAVRGNALRGYAYLLACSGQLENAKKEYERARKEFSGVSPFGQAHCERGLGDVYTKQNRLDDARSAFDKAVRLYDEAQKNPSLGTGLVSLGMGRVSQALGDLEGAIAKYRGAAELFDKTQLNEPYELGVAHDLIGDAYAGSANKGMAVASYQIALATFAAMGADNAVRRVRSKL